jgi:hypothetical protein
MKSMDPANLVLSLGNDMVMTFLEMTTNSVTTIQ